MKGKGEVLMYLLLKWVVFALIVSFTAWLIPGISVENYFSAFIAAAAISIINVSLKPILTLITLPINVFSLGLFTLVINALLLMFTAYLVPGFEVDGFIAALLGSIMISVLSVGLSFI